MSAVTLGLVVTLALVGPPPAAAAFEQHAREVERGIAEGRPDALVLDLDAVARFATRGVTAPEGLKAGFVSGLKKEGNDRRLGQELAGWVKKGGSVKLLRVTPTGNSARALYRAKVGEGLNYVELYLERAGAAGKVRVVDAYVYLVGESVRETTRRMFLLLVSQADQSLLGRMMGKDRELVANFAKLRKMREQYAAKSPQAVLATYEELPPSLRKERVALMLRLQAAMELEDTGPYQAAIDDWEAAFPGDPSLDLVSIDGYFLRQDYEGAIACLGRLDARVKDPFLRYFEGAILMQKGDLAAAKQRLRSVLEADPTLPDPYWVLIAIALKEKDFAAVTELLDGVEIRAGVALADLRKIDEYAAYVRSREYKAWMKRRPPAAP